MQKGLYKAGYTQNRELSWLRFNERCLEEANDPDVPLLERLTFVSIFSSNLDEFFSVRVGALLGMNAVKPDSVDNKTGWTAAQQLKRIYAAADKLCQRREQVYKDLKKALKREGIYDLTYDECTKEEKVWLRHYFENNIQPVLGAQIIDPGHPLPPLQSGVVYIAALMKHREKEVMAIAPVPGGLKPIIRLPDKKTVRFVHIGEVILANIDVVFRGAEIKERLRFTITRNAAVDLSSQTDTEDYRVKMIQMLKKRKNMDLVRMEISGKPSPQFAKYLSHDLKMDSSVTYVSEMPLDHSYLWGVPDLLEPEHAKRLKYAPYTPKFSPAFKYSRPLFAQIQKKDVLLSYPYESMDPFLLLVKEAATDPNVLSIRITIYRLAKRARLVDYLCLAAENGKEVTVLIELKARFDEQHNIDYAEKLAESGCNVMYGFEDYKVHSKICMISRKTGSKLQHVVLISTGNFNESTAKLYTDVAYLTANPDIVADGIAFFHNMMSGVLDGKYKRLIVSPVSLKQTIIREIERETRKGKNGRILCKMNAITDEEIIMKLQEASAAGVNINLIIRSISCILPEVPGKTDNLHIRSIVGRYLEHNRIYVFGTGRYEKMYIASADFMTRNTERRVEIGVPILDESIRERLHEYLDLCLRDNVKARVMNNKGELCRIYDNEEELSVQDEMMKRTVGSKEVLQGAAPRPVTKAHTGIVFKTKYEPRKRATRKSVKTKKENSPKKDAAPKTEEE